MLDWKNIEEYENHGTFGEISIDSQPEVILWHDRTGPVIGKAFKFSDNEIIFIAPGYHGFKFTKFATFNLPVKE